jgi:hypothetical protein
MTHGVCSLALWLHHGECFMGLKPTAGCFRTVQPETASPNAEYYETAVSADVLKDRGPDWLLLVTPLQPRL